VLITIIFSFVPESSPLPSLEKPANG
jgi:hypothetical protein